MKGGAESNTKLTATKSSAPPDANPVRRSAGQPQNLKTTPKSASSPLRVRMARAGSQESPLRRQPPIPKEDVAVRTPKRAAGPETKRKVFSPVRDPLGNSGSPGDISGKQRRW